MISVARGTLFWRQQGSSQNKSIREGKSDAFLRRLSSSSNACVLKDIFGVVKYYHDER